MKQIRLNQQFDAFFVGTNFMQTELIRQGFNADRIHIFPPVPARPETDHGLSRFVDENIVVFTGQIIRGKGLDFLLRAMSLVRTSFKLVIFGDGSHRRYCEEMTRKLKLTGYVEFKGFTAHETMVDYYTKATLLAVPSVWPEPCGMIGFEAMRFGLPVVGFDAGGISDWLHHDKNGYLIPVQDVEGMAAKIELLLKNKDIAARLGRNGRDYVDRNFNISTHIDGIAAKFDEFIDAAN